ncbi:conserved hypothetical protein [Stenotrophomonas maltophilia K279a]|uniref:Uncharacterized protein n=2 Tax=Stenotrophomonas maltophilia TaxID=40324 RepID=B2FIW7_STRMK|nr:conserved hypothetical protein [Stenotrophomonas maltophilia K279a]
MMRHKTQFDGWSSAMEPSFVTAPVRIEYVTYAQKQRDAAELRALVEAHIAAGGAYVVLSATTAAQVSA